MDHYILTIIDFDCTPKSITKIADMAQVLDEILSSYAVGPDEATVYGNLLGAGFIVADKSGKTNGYQEASPS